MKNLMTRLFREEEGQGMVEYAILLAGIALVVGAAVWLLGSHISGLFGELQEKLKTTTSP